jgi:hypothetical protein
VGYALRHKCWWRSDEELRTEAWKQFQNVLAPNLPYAAWQDLLMAVLAVNQVNGLAGVPRPGDKLDEFFLESTVTALTLYLKEIETARDSLEPYLSLVGFSRMRPSRLRQWWYFLNKKSSQ